MSEQIRHAAVKQGQVICKFICFYLVLGQCSKNMQQELSILDFSEDFVFWKISFWTPKTKFLGSSYQPCIPIEKSSAFEDPIATHLQTVHGDWRTWAQPEGCRPSLRHSHLSSIAQDQSQPQQQLRCLCHHIFSSLMLFSVSSRQKILI